jgi:glycosyltransferase involved in cell wall biosynthesis
MPKTKTYKGVKLIYLSTVKKKGFDSLFHSLKATYHIIRNNTADVVIIGNGGNSFCSILLRLFRKKTIVANDGVDWQREKWPWYGKLFLYLSSYITAMIPNAAFFDNIYAKDHFEKKFNKKFYFIPTGLKLSSYKDDHIILEKLNLKKNGYFIFVGRFIPDKGLQYLIPAFKKVETRKKLLLVGGSPNPSVFENSLKQTKDKRILFPGYIYGNDTINLIKYAYAYIQPSDVEGLSPVILTAMGLQTPVICSNIRENLFIVRDMALTFKKGNILDLRRAIRFSLKHTDIMLEKAKRGRIHIEHEFSWEKSINEHIKLFLLVQGQK